MDAVDQAAVECFGQNLGSAFDHDRGDAAAGEVAKDGFEGAVFEDEGALAVLVGKEMGLRGEVSGAGEDYAPGLAGMADAADGEAGVIGAEGSGADDDGIDLGAKAVGIEAGEFAGEPPAFGRGAGDAAIKRECALGDDEGEAGDDPFIEGAVEGRGFGGEDAGDDFDAGGAQLVEAAAGMFGIRVNGGDYYAGDAGGYDGIDAGAGAALGGAGLEGDVEGRPARQGGTGETVEGFDFRVWAAGGAMPAF
jgi:hypothetical protein